MTPDVRVSERVEESGVRFAVRCAVLFVCLASLYATLFLTIGVYRQSRFPVPEEGGR